MALPSYARATASSISKASPKSSKTTRDPGPVKSTPSPNSKTRAESRGQNKSTTSLNPRTPTTPSKPSNSIPIAQEKKKALKRPSTLTSHQKDIITYKRDLCHINPRDASKPCFLATLPSELRTQIYTYIVPSIHYIAPSWPAIIKHKQHVPPALLNTSRAIRIEAAYTYYTGTAFHFTVRNLDFSPVIRWLEGLAPQYRALLPRNHHGLEINVLPSVRNTFTYPPKGWLLDGYLEHHWRVCQPFGNIYTVPSDLHKTHFVVFCRLAEWWRWWSTRPLHGDVRCKYNFEQSPFANPFGMPDLHDEAVLRSFLRHHGMVVAMPCVDKAWRRNRNTARVMTAEGVKFLDALDKWYKDRWGEIGGNEEWNAGIEEAKKAMRRW